MHPISAFPISLKSTSILSPAPPPIPRVAANLPPITSLPFLSSNVPSIVPPTPIDSSNSPEILKSVLPLTDTLALPDCLVLPPAKDSNLPAASIPSRPKPNLPSIPAFAPWNPSIATPLPEHPNLQL